MLYTKRAPSDEFAHARASGSAAVAHGAPGDGVPDAVRPTAGPHPVWPRVSRTVGRQYMDIPPLTAAVVPVMKALSSLA